MQSWDELFGRVYDERIEPSDITATKSTLYKRAVVARALLIDEFALEGRTTEYGTLAERVGSNAAYMGKVLGTVDLVGQRLGEPHLSALVESADTIGPSTGYFCWEFIPTEHRLESTRETTGLRDAEKEFWRERRDEVYEYEGWHRL